MQRWQNETEYTFAVVHSRVQYTVVYSRVFRFRFPDCRHRAFLFSAVAEVVVFGDMSRSSTRRGRAPANNSDVLAMFRLVYSGEGATEPLVDDFS